MHAPCVKERKSVIAGGLTEGRVKVKCVIMRTACVCVYVRACVCVRAITLACVCVCLCACVHARVRRA